MSVSLVYYNYYRDRPSVEVDAYASDEDGNDVAVEISDIGIVFHNKAQLIKHIKDCFNMLNDINNGKTNFSMGTDFVEV